MHISRRKFLAAAPLAAGAILQIKGHVGDSISGNDLSPVTAVRGDALSNLTWDSFYPFINTDFSFGHGGNMVSLKLVDMVDSKPKGFVSVRGQECFILKFQGPYHQPLLERTYDVDHFNLGNFDLFITDGGKVGRVQYYLAVINRIVT